MTLPPGSPRRSIPLAGYDYSQPGAYFFTIVTHGRECIFGDIFDGRMHLNAYGRIVEQAWYDLPNHYPHVELDAFCMMPNHVHAVVILVENDSGAAGAGGIVGAGRIVGAGLRPAPTSMPAPTNTPMPSVRHPVTEVVRAFKSFSARRINEMRKSPSVPVWQRKSYEHIIRNDSDLQRIHLYIESNPENRGQDGENPQKHPWRPPLNLQPAWPPFRRLGYTIG